MLNFENDYMRASVMETTPILPPPWRKSAWPAAVPRPRFIC